ncbi:MAG: efflux RND transporter periplasmic adaptor subunit [Planctomycetes bacterium]|nr:efflux RND transporter periplasmic adaptor subunit [Planctomycetota bacterium]
MKRLLKIAVVLAILGGLGAAAYGPIAKSWRARNRPVWRTEEVTQGEIISVVNSTGTIKPVLEVSVGSFVSGPIIELCADFNQVVKKGEVLARVDPQLPEAALARARASLATREADVERAQAIFLQAVRDEKRALALQDENEEFISVKEMDVFHFNRLSLEAQVKQSKAIVEQAEADVENALTNLGYTDITSPVDGIVIDRKIDQGQTLAAQFQTPELFIVAPDMEKKMYVIAAVDEADIGLIQQAQKSEQPVEFRVDAYPDELFTGKIEQIRKSSTTTQNVVTYPVIVAAANPELKLYPGMTANISFQTEKKEGILRIPNSALRFYPKRSQVRKEDHDILDGKDDSSAQEMPAVQHSAAERTKASRKRRHRHVWLVEGEWLRAVSVETGLSDSKSTELVSGELKKGDQLVTGEKLKK